MYYIALSLSAILNITTLMNIYQSYREKSSSIVFWVALLMFFNLPHFFTVINSELSSELYIYNEASAFCILFNITYFIFWNVKMGKKKLLSENEYTVENKTLFYYLLLLLFIGSLVWSIGIYRVSGTFLGSSWTDMRNMETVYMLIGQYLFLAGSGSVFAFFILKKRIELILGLTICIYVIFLLKARIYIIPITAPFIIYYLYREKIRLKNIVKIGLVSISLIFMVFFLQQFRYLGNIDDLSFSVVIEVSQNTIENISSGGGEFDLKKAFYLFIENDNNYYHFEEGLTYKRLALWFVPSSILDIKPDDFTFDMWNAIYPDRNNTGGSFHPIFYGDLYANFGFIGFLMAMLWVVIIKFIDFFVNLLTKSLKIALMPNVILMYVLLSRGAVYNSIVFLLWSTILVLGVWLVSKISIRKGTF
ncbi:O-antigen polymerase [Exiguobacterium sp. TRN 1102]|uniref:O-antigen polymerase n=1 Tax=Exiguobacterium sp. TRN 1102 TaxID=3420732 RepID=UPI003D78AA9D